MQIANDPKTSRGFEIVCGKVPDHSKINILHDLAEGELDTCVHKDCSVKRGSKRDSKSKQADCSNENPFDVQSKELTGLELGRKLLVVLNTPAVPSDKPCPWCKAANKCKAQAVRVVDHGIAQKEAIRRLFDAQVLLRSYEEQLQDIETRNKQLFFELRERLTGEQKMRGSAVIEDSDPLAEAVPQGEILAKGESLKFMMDEEMPPIPYWLRGDQKSREFVEKFKCLFMAEIQEKGDRMEITAVQDLLWNIGSAFAFRWAGGPDEELTAMNKRLGDKLKEMQRGALQESNMLRQHSRKVEVKFKELQKNAKQMKAALKQAQDVAAASQRAAAHYAQLAGGRKQMEPKSPTNLDGAGTAGTAGMVVSHQGHEMAANIVATWQHPISPVGGAGGMLSIPGSPAAARNFGGGDFGGSGGGATGASTNFMNFDYETGVEGVPSYSAMQRDIDASSGRDTLEDFGPTEEELEQMDNEFFEPLNTLDPDMREMCIDAVNAKVRRILSMDSSKWINGRLPFGLRPDQETDAEAALKEQLRKVLAQLAATEEERDMYKSEAEKLRRKLEEMRKRFGLDADGNPIASTQSAEDAAAQMARGRGTVVKEEPPPPPAPTGISEEECKRRVEKGKESVRQEMLKQIRELEAKINAKETEIEELRKRLQDALKPKPTKPEPVQKAPIDDGKDAELARLRSQLKKLQADLDEARANPKIVEVIKEVPAKEAPKKVEKAPTEVVQKGDSEVAKQSQKHLHSVLQVCSRELDVEASANGQKAVEKILGTVPGKKSETKDDVCDKALAGLETWTSEILLALGGLKKRLTEKAKEPEPVIIEKPVEHVVEEVPPPKVDSPREGKCYVKGHEEYPKLKKELEDEISRLLLIIDELRRRIEALQQIPFDPNDDTINSIMEKVGLKDLADAKGGAKLKGVFHRLYQDAIERIQRLGMVRERALVANRAYTAALMAINDGEQPYYYQVPDFERLNDTAKSSLSSMWYHSERMFRRCCEYAISQSLKEASSYRNHCRLENFADDTGVGLHDDMSKHSRGRLPFRRPEKRKISPTRLASDEVGGNPASFKHYVTALREGYVDSSRPDMLAKKVWKVDSAAAADTLKAMKTGTTNASRTGAPQIGRLLNASQSLPALPRGRGGGCKGQEFDGIHIPSPAGSHCSLSSLLSPQVQQTI